MPPENATPSSPVTPLTVLEEPAEAVPAERAAPDLDVIEESMLSNNDDNTPPEISIIGDLPGYKSTHIDAMLATVYDGEHVRDNDGTHLDGGIEDDAAWQDRHKRIIAHTLSHYDLPGGPVGRLHGKTLAAEINEVLERKWNMDRPLFSLL